MSVVSKEMKELVNKTNKIVTNEVVGKRYGNKIQKWIADGEGPNLDFKQTITSAAKIARSIVAFANSRGGKIVVGVEDHGHIIGVDIGGEEYELLKSAREYCKPAIELEFETYEMHGKLLLIAYVEESYEKPHYAVDKKKRENTPKTHYRGIKGAPRN